MSTPINSSFTVNNITVNQTEPAANKNIGLLTWNNPNNTTEKRTVEYADLNKAENCLYKFFVINVLELLGKVRTVNITNADNNVILRARVWTDDLTKLEEIGAAPEKVTYTYQQISQHEKNRYLTRKSFYNKLITINQVNREPDWRKFDSKKYGNKLFYGVKKPDNPQDPEKYILSNGEGTFEITPKDKKKLLQGKAISCKKINPELTITEGTLTLPEDQTTDDFVELKFTPSE